MQMESLPLVLRRGAVVSAVGLSYTSIFRLMRSGSFPRPIPLGDKAVGWRRDEIEAWLDARTRERDSGGAA